MEIDLLLPVLPPNLYLAVEGSLMLYKNGRREEEGINFKRVQATVINLSLIAPGQLTFLSINFAPNPRRTAAVRRLVLR